jgi:TonB family protein
MKRFRAKLLLLFSTFFVGVTAYYVYYLLPAPVETQRPPEVSTLVSEQISNSPEEKPKESDFYDISPCDDANSFKQYSARAKGTISGGVVNHRVKCGDLPEHFQNPSNVSGTVTVYVLINQFGGVRDARIMNGHKLLNKSVLRAARQTRFVPFILGGEPVKVRGVLIYKFDNEGKVGLQKMKIPL